MLERHDARIDTVRPARKEPFADREVRELLGSVSTVVIAKGRSFVTRPAAEVKPADLKGPTGNYRAPMIRKGKTLVVGFAPDALAKLL